MRHLILLPFVLLLGGCFDLPRVPEPPVLPPITLPKIEDPTPPPPKKDGKVDNLDQAKYEMQLYAEKAAQAEARYEVLKKQKADDDKRASEEKLQSQALWISGICLILAAIAGVAAFVSPLGKKTLIAAAIGFTCIAACAQAFQWAVPYLPWIGGTLLVGGGIWGAFNFKKLGATTKVASTYGDRLEEWLQDLPEEARAQANKIIEDAKKESQTQAEGLGIHDQLQYLRGKLPSLWQRITNKIG